MKTTVAVALALTLSFTGIVGKYAEAAKSKPDLIVSAVSAPASTSPGAAIGVSATVRNRGNATSSAFSVSYYLSTSPSSISGAALLGSQNVAFLSVGSSIALATSVGIPQTTASGTFYLVAFADSANVVQESNESNNTRASGAIAVTLPVPTQLTLWVTDALTRIQPTDPLGTSTTASIKAARNEAEAVQVIIRAPDGQALSNVNATVSDLVGPGTLNKSAFTLYREQYVPVTTPSSWGGNGSPYPPGWWPDALIPFTALGGRFPAAPFSVPAGTNQPIWVEVYVPAGTPAGLYTGTLTVTADGYAAATVPVSLTVWGFTLPARPSLRSNFQSYNSYWAKTITYLGITDAAQAQQVQDNYYRALIGHRLSPHLPDGSNPAIDRSTGAIDPSASDPILRTFMEDLQVTGWGLPFSPGWPWVDPLGVDRGKAKRYVTESSAYLSANGWADRAYTFPIDEPRTPEAYQEARDIAALIHEAAPGFKVLMTVPEPSGWTELDRALDIWVPVVWAFDETAAAQQLAYGKEVWSYTAGVQPNGMPTWLLDYPLIHSRIMPWVNWRYGLTGLLYWTTTYWEAGDPWTNATNGLNGDGLLFYPGDAVGTPLQPIPSLRLKALRDGFEDYEYLWLLSALGDKTLSDSQAFHVGTSWTNWSKDPAQLQTAREQLAQRIIQLGGQ